MTFTRLALLAALLLLPAPSLLAQTGVDPSGHWEGTVHAPGKELNFEVDLAKTSIGDFSGTLGIPSENLKGLPLLKVSVEGKSVSFYARRDQTLAGALSADGQSISGDFTIEGFSLPFSLTRTGDARFEPPIKSPAISKDLEGTWTGTLAASGMSLRVNLTMSNQPDGTATGRVVNLDQGGLEIPVAITQMASSVTLEATVLASSFAGVLTAEGTELVGTWTQGPATLPLTFRRAAK